MNSDYLKAQVRVAQILFPRQAWESGCWTIALCEVEELLDGELDTEVIKITGNPYEITVGGSYLLEAQLSVHERYGESYRIKAFSRKCNMDDPEDKRNFLSSLFTERQIDELYAALPDPYTALLQSDVAAISKTKGVGPATAQRMIQTSSLSWSMVGWARKLAASCKI